MKHWQGTHVDGRVEAFWPWFLQRLTAVVLVAFLAVHIWVGHFAGLGRVTSGEQEELVLFDIVKRRLAQGLFIFVDFSLLALALYHGLNGVRGILLEWRVARQRMRLCDGGLTVLGFLAFAFGARALLAFIL